MCKFNPKNDSRYVDPCMEKFIEFLNSNTEFKSQLKILGCCCGHFKYPMTIICKDKGDGKIYDIVSAIEIKRKKKFYKKDKKGVYFIPEVSNGA